MCLDEALFITETATISTWIIQFTYTRINVKGIEPRFWGNSHFFVKFNKKVGLQ